MKHFAAAAAALLALSAAPPAWACSTCACGDYTITLMGAEKPYAGRLRGAIDFSARSETKGRSGQLDYRDIDEWRTSIGLSYSLDPRLTLGAQLPLVRKRVRSGNLGEIESRGLGDADLLLRWVAWQDKEMPRHMAGVRAGLRLPTSAQISDDNGDLVDIDAQPDPGAAAPSLGLWYGYYRFPLFISASGYTMAYGDGNQGFEPGDAFVGSLSAQYALTDALAVQAGLDARHTRTNRFSGVDDPDSGGSLAMGFLGAALRFGPDLLVHAGVQLPLHDALDGAQQEDTAYRAGVAYDF